MDPKIKIDNPDNLSYEITGITCDSYDDLLEELEDYVANEEYEHSFHFDKAHSYRIDGRAWQHGTAIYGRKDKDAGNGGGVITKSKLVPLRDADEFREHVIKVGHRMYDEPESSIATRAGGKKKRKRGKPIGLAIV